MAKKEMGSQEWLLAKYACHVSSGSTNQEKENWKVFTGGEDVLRLVITESDHLIVSVGGRIQESYSLVGAGAWMRGVSKGDSLLFLCKHKVNSRRFRVKFVGGESHGRKACEQATSLLNKYFPVKRLTDDGLPQKETAAEKWEGHVAIGQLAKMALGELAPKLPLVYNECNLSGEELGVLVQLCLADVNFPAFVGAVEQELQRVAQGTSV